MSTRDPKIDIFVKGGVGSGKTTIATLIEHALRDVRFLKVKYEGLIVGTKPNGEPDTIRERDDETRTLRQDRTIPTLLERQPEITIYEMQHRRPPTRVLDRPHLAYRGPALEQDHKVLTVELTSKWYHLVLLWGGDCHLIGFDQFDAPEFRKEESAYLDHAPNPMAVQRYAEAKGYHLDGLALELMIGRWELEYHNHYGLKWEGHGARTGSPA